MSWKQTVRITAGALMLLLMVPAIALAAQSSSSKYQVNEVFFGSGGVLNSCSSGQYCSKQSAGETVVGKTCSDPLSGGQYCAQGGFNTDRTPYIQFNVTNTNIDLGKLTANTTKTANATFSVKTYLAHGYSVINASDPPANDGYKMKTPTIPAVSALGTEQFGINLVANTSPVAYGADPAQLPDTTFGFGAASIDYSDPNHFKYGKGDVVAASPSSTSTTNYTISYLFNISNVTPGGIYYMRHILVATGTY